MRIIFDDEALDDLRRIRAWIAKGNPRAANELIKRIFDKVENLIAPELTYMGRSGLDPRTHELIEYPYIIVYEVHEDSRRHCGAFCRPRGAGSQAQGRLAPECPRAR